jgi:hypothetical protein
MKEHENWNIMRVGIRSETLITVESEEMKLYSCSRAAERSYPFTYNSRVQAAAEESERNKVRKIITQIKINNAPLHTPLLPLNTALQPFSALSSLAHIKGKKFNQSSVFVRVWLLCAAGIISHHYLLSSRSS